MVWVPCAFCQCKLATICYPWVVKCQTLSSPPTCTFVPSDASRWASVDTTDSDLLSKKFWELSIWERWKHEWHDLKICQKGHVFQNFELWLLYLQEPSSHLFWWQLCVCAAWLKAEVKDGCQTHFQSTFRSVFSGGPAVQSPRHPHPLPDKNRTTKLRQNHIELEVQKMSLFLEFFWEQNNKQIPWQPT